MQENNAEIIALKVLAWLIGEDDLVHVFLGASGLSADELRTRAGEPEVLIAVLDFVTQDDAWVEKCAEATGLDPHDPLRARHGLPGGQEMSWT